MNHLKDVVIITGKLALIIDRYIREFRDNGAGFEEFSDEAIIYALLEYSTYPRDVSKVERVLYVHGKCLEYEGKDHIYVTVDFDEQYQFFTVLYPQKSDDLPF